MKRGDKIYFARILPKVEIYEVYDLKLRTVEETWFSATDKKTGQAFLFHNKDIGNIVFFNREEALEKVKNAERDKKEINEESYYEKF